MGEVVATDDGELQPYSYRPLQPREIRVFTMQPSDNLADQIIGDLRTTLVLLSSYVESKIPYTTLSYAWGPTYEDDSHLSDFIVCEGRRLKVTPNLKQALTRIRKLESNLSSERQAKGSMDPAESSPATYHVIWIDSLCINQADLVERSEQVRMMGYIFGRSSSLLIWLGEPDKDPGRTETAQFTFQCRCPLPCHKGEENLGFDVSRRFPPAIQGYIPDCTTS